MISNIYNVIDKEVSAELEQFLDGYFKLALQNVFNVDELFDYLYRNPKLPVDVKEYFTKSKDRLDKVIAIDYLAHQIHVDPSLCDKVFGGGSEEAKIILDYLSGEEMDNDVRKYNRGMFTTIKSDDGIVWLSKSKRPFIIAGYASIAQIDKEGHLIPVEALQEAFDKFMVHPEFRNIQLLHSDLQVGVVLPEWKSPNGKLYKSGVDEKGLFIICRLRDDLNVMKKVKQEILAGNVRSFSIAGEALEKILKTKFGRPYYHIPHLEFSEITLCEQPVNQGSGFEVLQKSLTNMKLHTAFKISQVNAQGTSGITLQEFLSKQGKPGLIPKRIQVHRGGKVFERTQMVRPEEIHVIPQKTEAINIWERSKINMPKTTKVKLHPKGDKNLFEIVGKTRDEIIQNIVSRTRKYWGVTAIPLGLSDKAKNDLNETLNFLDFYIRLANDSKNITNSELDTITKRLSRRMLDFINHYRTSTFKYSEEIVKDLEQIVPKLQYGERSSKIIAIDHLVALQHTVEPTIIPHIFEVLTVVRPAVQDYIVSILEYLAGTEQKMEKSFIKIRKDNRQLAKR